jgi:uncharacterized protein YjiS (DUF1127 family)
MPHIALFESRSLRPARRRHVVLHCLSTLQFAGQCIRMWRARVRQRRDLAKLNPHLLRDIGITPYEAARECRKPFWR